MYIDTLREEYLPAIAELEKKSYPAELVLGLQSFKEEYEDYYLGGFSRCVFDKGELAGYIVAYETGDLPAKGSIYISDINCPNPRYLKRLLANFFYSANKFKVYTFCAEMRENSYRILVNRKNRHGNAVQILEDEYVPEHYMNREPAHRVTFQVNISKYLKDDWKSRFQFELEDTCLSEDTDIFREAFQYLKEPARAGIDLYEKKNMEFVIGSIQELILGYYQMFGEKIPARLEYYLYARHSARNKNAFSKTISTLKSYGYQEGRGNKRYEYEPHRGILSVNKKIEIYNTKFGSTLSGFRWLWIKNKRYLNSDKKIQSFLCFNRYSVVGVLLKVPYLSRKQYSYYLRKMLFLMEMEQKIPEKWEEQNCFRNIVRDIYSMLGGQEAEDCIRNIVERYTAAENYYHDWSLITGCLEEIKEVLTKGAVKAVLTRSYNYALKVSKNINALGQIVLEHPFTRRMFDIKEIRKEFSCLIRQNKDCDEYIKGLSLIITAKYTKKLSIPSSEKKKLSDFIERMRKYSPAVTIYTVYQIFGSDCLVKFLKGTYPCVFRPGEIALPYSPLVEFTGEMLKSRTKQAKHVYRELRRQELLPDVLKGCINAVQYQEILGILRHYNICLPNTAMDKIHEFRTVVETKGSPEFLVAGDASVCCMSFGSHKAIDYAIEEGFGIINVYYRERIIANSLIWINELYQCLVLDNIEAHPNYMRFEEELKACFQNAAVQIMNEHLLRYAVQGTQYNDIELYDEEMPTICFDKRKPFKVGTRRFYSDAGCAKVIAGHFPAEDRHLLYEEQMRGVA